jgi:hypothetical protein
MEDAHRCAIEEHLHIAEFAGLLRQNLNTAAAELELRIRFRTGGDVDIVAKIADQFILANRPSG